MLKWIKRNKWLFASMVILCIAIAIGSFVWIPTVVGTAQKTSGGDEAAITPGAGTFSPSTAANPADSIKAYTATPKDTILEDDPNGFADGLGGIYKPPGKGSIDKNDPREAEGVSLEPFPEDTPPVIHGSPAEASPKRKLIRPSKYNGVDSVIPYIKRMLLTEEPYKDDFGETFLSYEMSPPIFVEGIKEYPNSFPDEYIVYFLKDGYIEGDANVIVYDGQLDMDAMGPVGRIPAPLTKEEIAKKVEDKTGKKVKNVTYVQDYIRVPEKIWVDSSNPMAKITAEDGSVYYIDCMGKGNIFTHRRLTNYDL